MDVNGGEASLRWPESLRLISCEEKAESTAHQLIFNMCALKYYFLIDSLF